MRAVWRISRAGRKKKNAISFTSTVRGKRPGFSHKAKLLEGRGLEDPRGVGKPGQSPGRFAAESSPENSWELGRLLCRGDREPAAEEGCFRDRHNCRFQGVRGS